MDSRSGGGISVVGLLGVAFVVLKLCGVITWPWLWVLAPFWGGLILLIVLIGLFFAGLGLAALLEHLLATRKSKQSRAQWRK